MLILFMKDFYFSECSVHESPSHNKIPYPPIKTCGYARVPGRSVVFWQVPEIEYPLPPA